MAFTIVHGNNVLIMALARAIRTAIFNDGFKFADLKNVVGDFRISRQLLIKGDNCNIDIYYLEMMGEVSVGHHGSRFDRMAEQDNKNFKIANPSMVQDVCKLVVRVLKTFEGTNGSC